MRKIKRIAALFMAFIFCNCSFAAIVSDNDGSAFTTKAEFDALKKNFQKQIDDYNNSIDGKIDGAIASYLSGIQISNTEEHPILVDNYSQIRWMDAHKLKLNTLTYTNATTKNTTSAATYITPYYEERRNLISNYIQIWDFVSDASWGGALTHFFLMWKEDDSVITKQHWGIHSDTAETNHLPVVFIKQKLDEDTGRYYIENIENEGCWLTKISSFGHSCPNAASFYKVVYADHYPLVDGFQINEPTGDIYFDYRLDLDGSIWYRSQLNAKNTWIAGPFQEYRLDNQARTQKCTTMNDKYGKYDYPVHFSWNGNTNQVANDEKNLKNLMLGTDENTIVNCCNYYTSLDIVDGKMYDWTDSVIEKKKGYITEATYNGGKIGSGVRTNQPQDPSKGKTVEINFGMPLFPRYSIRTLFTGNFKDKSTSQDLSIGAGLPIVKDIDMKQNVTVSFDYDKVNSEYGSTTIPNKKIYVTLKKSNFETIGGTDFLSGSVNGGSKQTLNKVEVTGGQAKIEIDCEKGDNVWLRIANTTDGSEPGIYTTIKNLSIFGTIDN